MNKSQIIKEAKKVLKIEIDSAKTLSSSFNKSFYNVVKTIFDTQMKMFLRDNYIHGDLHGGNIIFNPQEGTVTIIDAGMITMLKDDIKQDFKKFLFALSIGDCDSLVQHLLNFSEKKDDFVDYQQFRIAIEQEVKEWINIETGCAPKGGPIVLEI